MMNDKLIRIDEVLEIISIKKTSFYKIKYIIFSLKIYNN